MLCRDHDNSGTAYTINGVRTKDERRMNEGFMGFTLVSVGVVIKLSGVYCGVPCALCLNIF